MDKIITTIKEAIALVADNSMIAIGGFFAAGVPRKLLEVLGEHPAKGLTLACGSGPLMGAIDETNRLIQNGQIQKVIDSYALPRSATKGQNNLLEQKVREGEIELEIFPMGTLAEKYRAGGSGIPAFYVTTGAGTDVAETTITNFASNKKEKETRIINNETCLLEYALRPDFAFVHANMGDRDGNLYYRKTAGNFNHIMAMAGKVTIAEVEKIVEPGEIPPDQVHTPGIFVQHVVQVQTKKFNIGID